MQKQTKTILAAVGDLFSTIKITEAAKRAGLEVEFVKTEKDLLEKAKFKPVLIIFDLNFSAMQPLKAVAKLKSSAELKSISLLGYLTHAQGELKQKAHEAGCNMVLARSAFSQNLPQILKRFADAP
jgi:PleD family two-component response regulator